MNIHHIVSPMNRPPLSDVIFLVCLICLFLTIVHILSGQYLYLPKYMISFFRTDVCTGGGRLSQMDMEQLKEDF